MSHSQTAMLKLTSRMHAGYVTCILVGVMIDYFACGLHAENLEKADSKATLIDLSDRIPYGREPVDYFSDSAEDAVGRLEKRIASGDIELTFDAEYGYLLSLLKELAVPVESQLLVFSKTARQPKLVSPESPRAVFFNDEVSIAWIPDAREVELTAVDPVKGVNFYTLSQPLPSPQSESDVSTRPAFARRDRCLACHAGRSTLEVPGLLLRAFQTDIHGKPQMGFSRVTHDMDYQRRWGGWFVTDSPKGLIHRGNLIGQEDNERHRREPGFGSVLAKLEESRFSTSYPYDRSDVVAHLVLAHQVHGTNLIVRCGMEARLGRHSDVEDRLIRYLVFADEPEWPVRSENVASSLRESRYARWFVHHGKTGPAAHSLREFDLVDRVFKYRLSFLIQSRLFDSLPDDCRDRLLTRLWSGLAVTPISDDFKHLAPGERRAIVSIVRTTVPRLPRIWRNTAE